MRSDYPERLAVWIAHNMGMLTIPIVIFHDAQRLVEIYQHVFNNFADDTFTCAIIKNVTLEKDPEKIPERPSFVQLRITLDPSSLCSSQEAWE